MHDNVDAGTICYQFDDFSLLEAFSETLYIVIQEIEVINRKSNISSNQCFT